MSLRVHAYPRLHLGLIDLGNITPRRYGGAGITIDAPPVRVAASVAEEMEFVGFEPHFRPSTRIAQVLSALRSKFMLPPLRLELEYPLPQHVGLGSKTATTLAALTAACQAWGLELGSDELRMLSGRGGTSGIGVHGFFYGGLLVDGGHLQRASLAHLPSSASAPTKPPVLNARTPVPDGWVFHLLLPPGRQFQGPDEVEFFRRNTPVPSSEVLSTMSLIYHQMLPAVREGDFEAFAEALNGLQGTGFKRREIAAQSEAVRELARELRRVTSLPVGMSSIGPLIFAVSPVTDNSIKAEIQEISLSHTSQYLGSFHARNSGYTVAEGKDSHASPEWSLSPEAIGRWLRREALS